MSTIVVRELYSRNVVDKHRKQQKLNLRLRYCNKEDCIIFSATSKKVQFHFKVDIACPRKFSLFLKRNYLTVICTPFVVDFVMVFLSPKENFSKTNNTL